jgi:hypothetical protein
VLVQVRACCSEEVLTYCCSVLFASEVSPDNRYSYVVMRNDDNKLNLNQDLSNVWQLTRYASCETLCLPIWQLLTMRD